MRFERAGEGVYDLWIDGRLVERGLGIDEVVRLIAERDETALLSRVPASFETPEERRKTWQRRECPKA